MVYYYNNVLYYYTIVYNAVGLLQRASSITHWHTREKEKKRPNLCQPLLQLKSEDSLQDDLSLRLWYETFVGLVGGIELLLQDSRHVNFTHVNRLNAARPTGLDVCPEMWVLRDTLETVHYIEGRYASWQCIHRLQSRGMESCMEWAVVHGTCQRSGCS